MQNITNPGTPVPTAALPTPSSSTPGDQETPATVTAPTSAPEPAMDNPFGLDPAQLIALQARIQGLNAQMIAKRAGVNVWTYYAWQQDPRFIAALNSWRRKMRQNIDKKMADIRELAARSVLDQARTGAAHLSRGVVRGLQIVAAEQPGSELAADIAKLVESLPKKRGKKTAKKE